MTSKSISEGRVENPASRADQAAVVVCQQGHDGGDSSAHEAARSPLWRTGIHEGSHICVSRFQNLELAGSTLIEGPNYQGLTWGPGSKRALRGKAEYDDDNSPEPDEVAARVAGSVSRFMPGPGEDDAADIVSSVRACVIDLMAGGAGEMIFLGDAPPMFMASDLLSANAVAGIVCRTPASIAAFIEHCYQEALSIVEDNKPVVRALAQALIDHPERTLDGAEIDQVIAETLNSEASKIEGQRRARWRLAEQNAVDFTNEKLMSKGRAKTLLDELASRDYRDKTRGPNADPVSLVTKWFGTFGLSE